MMLEVRRPLDTIALAAGLSIGSCVVLVLWAEHHYPPLGGCPYSRPGAMTPEELLALSLIVVSGLTVVLVERRRGRSWGTVRLLALLTAGLVAITLAVSAFAVGAGLGC